MITVFAIDESQHSLVKIVQRGQKWNVYKLKEIRKVEVICKDGRREIRYMFEWEQKQTERVWNNKKHRYCHYFDYKPYEDKDVNTCVTLEMVNYVQTWQFHIVQWHIPTMLKEGIDKIPEGYIPIFWVLLWKELLQV